MHATEENQPPPEPLICLHDDVPVRADDPKCLHPSSYCPFRDFCQVIEAARKKRRSEASANQNEPDC